MNHYSKEDLGSFKGEAAAFIALKEGGNSAVCRHLADNSASSLGDEDETENAEQQLEVLKQAAMMQANSRVSKLQLEQKLPPNFSQTIHSGRSSIKPDEMMMGRGGTTGGLECEASRAFLQDQELIVVEPPDSRHGYNQEATQMKSQEWNSDFTEFKSNINFEFKNRFMTGMADDDEDGS